MASMKYTKRTKNPVAQLGGAVIDDQVEGVTGEKNTCGLGKLENMPCQIALIIKITVGSDLREFAGFLHEICGCTAQLWIAVAWFDKLADCMKLLTPKLLFICQRPRALHCNGAVFRSFRSFRFGGKTWYDFPSMHEGPEAMLACVRRRSSSGLSS